MTFHSLLLLLSFFFLLGLAWLWHRDWSEHDLPHLAARTAGSVVHRLLQPRCPHDGPACRLSCAHSPVVGTAPAPVRPWCEITSRRGAAKRVNTQDFACPTRKGPSFGIRDAHLPALLGDGKHGRAQRIQTFRGRGCHTTFRARRDTPLSRLKTPSQQIALVRISLWPKGWTHRLPSEFSAPDKPPSSPGSLAPGNMHRPCTNVSSSISGSRICRWMNGAPGCAALSRCCGSGWPSTPARALLPVLHLGPGTQHMAHRVIHSLPEILAPGCLPLFTSDGFHVSFSALTAHFGQWREVGRRGRKVVCRWQVAASLISGQVKQSSRRRKLVQVRHVMRLGTEADLQRARPRIGSLWTTQHSVDGTGSTDRPPWGGSSRTSQLGEGSASPTPARPTRVVAGVLSRMSRPHAWLRVPLLHPRARGGKLIAP
jgi:hypothetical protein